MNLLKKEKVIKLLRILKKKSPEYKKRFISLLSKKFENKSVRIFQRKIDDSIYCKYFKIHELRLINNGNYFSCLYYDLLDTSKRIIQIHLNLDYFREYEWIYEGEFLEDGYGSLVEDIEEFMERIDKDVIQDIPYKKFIITVKNLSTNEIEEIEIFDKFEESARNKISMFQYIIEDVETITNFGKVVVVKSLKFCEHLTNEYSELMQSKHPVDNFKVIDITQNLDELQKFRNNYPDCEILKTYENLEIVNDFNPDVFDVYLKFKNN